MAAIAVSGCDGCDRSRYGDKVEQPLPAPGGRGSEVTRASVDSKQDCRRRLSTLAQPDPGRVRIGSWNIRWFPDGTASGNGDAATDVEWVACVIASERLDVLAVQEFKNERAALASAGRLVAELDRLTGGNWSVILDECTGKGAQHVGFVYNRKRLQLGSVRQVAALNPRGAACAGRLRPGLAALARFRGGLDIELMSIHLKAGVGARDADERRKSFAAIVDAHSRRRDSDFVVLGDFNTVGCRHCDPPLTSRQELSLLDAQLRRVDLTRLASSQTCTQYYRGRGGLLDHVVITTGTRELRSATARVGGVCAERSCRRVSRRDPPAALARLSDHCPVVVELDDRDLD